jgi:hypothetical protein
VKDGLCKISAYLNQEELRDFNRSVLAHGGTMSAYIREMLGFDPRKRGAPKGPRQKKAPQPKTVKSKRAGKEKGRHQGAAKLRMPQLPFQD